MNNSSNTQIAFELIKLVTTPDTEKQRILYEVLKLEIKHF